jgi:hypothetical protein
MARARRFTPLQGELQEDHSLQIANSQSTLAVHDIISLQCMVSRCLPTAGLPQLLASRQTCLVRHVTPPWQVIEQGSHGFQLPHKPSIHRPS